MGSSVELFQVVTVGEAKKVLEAHWPRSKAARVSLEEAQGRVLAQPVSSSADVPPFTRSTVDGYAVRACDTFGASPSLPAYLSLCGEVRIGRPAPISLLPGQAAYVPTGGMLPPGADAAVMIENTEEVDSRTVAVLRPVAPGENLIIQGEDVRAGQRVFAAGHRLRPQDLALLASCGVKEVEVRLPLRVSVISTGDELADPGSPLAPGQVYDCNSYGLAALVAADGGVPLRQARVEDDPGRLAEALGRALEQSDVVLLSGGSSVGSRDFTLEAIGQLGGKVLFHGVAIGPGKPTLAATVQSRLLVGLPGHPASAMVVYLVMLSPLVACGSYEAYARRFLRARLTRRVASRSGREDYIFVRLLADRGEMLAEPILGKSGLVSPLAQADGLAVIPLEEEGKESGEPVEVMLL